MPDTQQENENCRYNRTTIGFIGFIVSILVAVISFIVAEDGGEYHKYALIFGSVMLFITILFFGCVLHESRYISSTLIQQPDCLQLDPLPSEQPEHSEDPELSTNHEQELHWEDKTRHDLNYVRSVLGFPPGDSDDSIESENENNFEIIQLQNLSTSGSSTEINKLMHEMLDESNTKDLDKESRCESTADIKSHSPKAAPSKAAGESSEVVESRSDVSPLEGISALSLSDYSDSTKVSGEKQTENVSAALSKLSLDDSEKQAVEMAKQDPSSTVSESKLDEDTPQAGASKEGTEKTECQIV